MTRLPRSFFSRGARTVSKDLLGKKLIHAYHGQHLSGIIVETEAYCDSDEPDLACHGHRTNQGNPTPRTAVMFGPAGHAYVYFTYGIHWMFNIVTGEEEQANAVLIRAVAPLEGKNVMLAHRNGRSNALTNGPAKLAQAFAIDKRFNGHDLCQPHSQIWLEDAPAIEPALIQQGPRIGLGKTPEPWYSKPWRYWISGNPHVSK